MLDKTTAYGLEFTFPAGDKIVGASLRRHGEFARVELDFLVDQATGSGTMVDVGANIGAIALPFARRCPDWTVLAIEAHRGLHGLLAANAVTNRLYNTEVHHAAAGAERGLVEFPALSLAEHFNFGALGFGSTTSHTETVRMLTLDEISSDDTRLVKIDVEGFEPQVLKGATGLLARRRAIWLVEATIQNPEATSQVISIFQGLGYAVFWFYAPLATPRSEKDPPLEPGAGDSNIVALPPGVANTWQLTAVSGPGERRPNGSTAYPYLARYGYS